MPLERLTRARSLYDGGVCKGCGVRLDVTICRCQPSQHPRVVITDEGFTANVIEGEHGDIEGVPI